MLVVPKYSMRAWFWTGQIFYLVHYLTSHNDSGARPFLKISHAVCLFPDYLLGLSETASSSSLTSSPSPSSTFQGFPLSGFSLIASLLSAQLAWSPEVGRAVCSVHSVCIFLLNLHVEVMYHWSLCIMQFNAMVRRLHSIYILIPIYLNQHVGVFMYHIFTWAFLLGSYIIMLTSAMQC